MYWFAHDRYLRHERINESRNSRVASKSKISGTISELCRQLTLPFHDGGRYHIETSPLICGANQLADFYMITSSVMKGLNEYLKISFIRAER